MHPIEHLRHVARAAGADPVLVATEAASALAQMAVMDPVGLVPACRRLVERHLTAGPVWWLSARVLAADDPRAAARQAASELELDPTADRLASALPDGVSALAVGWPELVGEALRDRGDVEGLVVDAGGDGVGLVRRLSDAGSDVALVRDIGVGSAAAVAGLVLLEAHAAGPAGILASPGSLSAAAVAAQLAVPVWAVTGVGRVLPSPLWDALVARLDASGAEPWDRPVELVPAPLLAWVVGPGGGAAVEEGLAAATCPAAPELLRAPG